MKNDLKREVVCVASGTEALLLALLACGVEAGNKVITTPFTFIATTETIAQCGATPVFVDIERWPDKKKFKKALGVYSSLTQSGGSPGRTRQGKEGSRHGRRVLFQVCMGCVKVNTPANDPKDHYMRQVARGKPRLKALVSTMGKLAEIVYHCLKAGEPYHYQGIYR